MYLFLLRYISIGLYMPMFGLLAAGFLLTTLGLWFKLLAEQNDNKVGNITNNTVKTS